MQQHASYLEVTITLTQDELKRLYHQVISKAETVYVLGITQSSAKKSRAKETVKFRLTLGIVDKSVSFLSLEFKPNSIESFRIRGILEPEWMSYLFSVNLINLTYIKGLFND